MSSAELCLFCPKLCSFACPVSEETRKEAHTPWGKVSLAALSAAPDASSAFAFGACTGCLACTHHCPHENDAPALLYRARAAAVRANAAPPVWTGLATAFARKGHGQAGDLSGTMRALRAGERTLDGAPLLFPGCAALAQGGDEVRDALSAARALGAPLSLVPEGALCCGLELVQGGHPEQGEAHGGKVRALLVRPRTPLHLVFLQAGCARHVLEGWHLPEGSQVEHVTSYLARALVSRPGAARPPQLPGAAVFHDPCELARGLRELTAPRAILGAIYALGVEEPAQCGVDTPCCGAGGLLPRTMPEVAQGMAARRKAELGPRPVTADPACALALGADEVVSVLARWLSAAPGKGAT